MKSFWDRSMNSYPMNGWIAILLAIFLVGRGVAQSPDNPKPAPHDKETGTICVLPNSPNPPIRISPGGEYNPSTLTIGLDQRPPVAWPHKSKVKIEEIPLVGRHLITLRSDGKRIQSFWFSFSRYKDTMLCVSYDGYQGVQFGDKYDTYWCRCK
jgi:hypothetical protein